MKSKVLVSLALAGCTILGAASGAGAGKAEQPRVVNFSGSLALAAQKSSGFVREQVVPFEASYGKAPQNKVPWVEVACVDAATGTIRQPGTTTGDVPLWVGRDYSAPYEVLVGDAGGSSRWKDAGYPDVKCQGFLYLYYDLRGYETVALFGTSEVFYVSGATA